MDDLFAGADNRQQAAELIQEVVDIFAAGQFPLGKWAATSPNLCPGDGPDIVQLDEFEGVSTLGLIWDPKKDVLSLKVSSFAADWAPTKRLILSETSKLFDPLGWVGPVVIVAKILIQDLWIANIDWDTPVTQEFARTWIDFYDSLPDLEALKVPRWINFSASEKQQLELHGIAKTRVAPVKAQTIPRLELYGAVLLVRLLNKLQEELKLNVVKTYAWSDSQVVLAWI